MGKKGPICKFLKDYIDNEVTVTLYTGQVVSGKLVKIKDGLVVLLEAEIISPFVAESLTIVKCEDIAIVTIQTSDFNDDEDDDDD
jgi:small nuclear ribonucleoprotein (snRNP)-like protein